MGRSFGRKRMMSASVPLGLIALYKSCIIIVKRLNIKKDETVFSPGYLLFWGRPRD